MHVGIDLGTTFCCVAYIGEDGHPVVIPSSDGEQTTPSVIWFDGKQAYVGKKANLRKLLSSLHIYEFVKRDIGKPVEIPPHLYRADRHFPETAPYEINGFKYGAAGLSGLMLRKLKKDAIRYFKRLGRLEDQLDEKDLELDAVITVPAYFGDKERQETRLAGYAAGLNVIGIINEPTAAALSYGLLRQENSKLMIFDLGGGTFDVTLLEMKHGEAQVLASGGDNSLGGRDWDDLIQLFLYQTFVRRNGRHIPDHKGFEVQQLALQAKFDLTESDRATVFLSMEEGDLDVTLFRDRPVGRGDPYDMGDASLDPEKETTFYFSERATELLNRCRVLCESVLQKTRIVTPAGVTRSMRWSDLDEIVLAGGSCRMPMVVEMLERLSHMKIRRHIEGFSYDTAIAVGAALYGQHKQRVKDVTSKSIGVELVQGDRHYIEHLICKDTRLPVTVEKTYKAGAVAVLAVYEGESTNRDECVLRGRIELDNPAGMVTITIEADMNGILHVMADYPPHGRKVKAFCNELYLYDERATPLRNAIQAVHLNL